MTSSMNSCADCFRCSLFPARTESTPGQRTPRVVKGDHGRFGTGGTLATGATRRRTGTLGSQFRDAVLQGAEPMG